MTEVPGQKVEQNPGQKVGPKKRKADSLDTEQSHKKRFWQFLDGTYGHTQREMEDVKDYMDIIGVEEFKKICSYQKQKTSKATNVQKRLLELQDIKVTESEYLDICNDFKERMDQKDQQIRDGDRMFERLAYAEEGLRNEKNLLEADNQELREKIEELNKDHAEELEDMEKDKEEYKARVQLLEFQLGNCIGQFFRDFEPKMVCVKEYFDLPAGTQFMYRSGWQLATKEEAETFNGRVRD